MKVLVVGQGGREHALAWKIQQSPLVDRVFVAPGNPGTAAIGENVDIAATDLEGLVNFAVDRAIELTVVGPEAPLCDGIVDLFRERGRLCLGPDKAAAEIEGSKRFARELCEKHRIPGPSFWSFENPATARSFLENRPDGPIVVKASGLAADEVEEGVVARVEGACKDLCGAVGEVRDWTAGMWATGSRGETREGRERGVRKGWVCEVYGLWQCCSTLIR